VAFLRLLPFGLACAGLLAQAPAEILDAVAPGASVYVFARSPQLAQAKLQGLGQRFGDTTPDPLAELQTRFGLRRLPSDRRGLALVFEGELGAAETHPLLYLAVREPKELLESLKAKPGEEGLYTFSAGGGARALTLREGWAILGDRSQAQALRQAARSRTSLRSQLGDLAPWLEAQDVAAPLSPEGLSGSLHQVRKEIAGTRGGAGAQAADPLVQAEPILGQIQREVRQIGARAELDEHGNLQVVLRAQLHPQGQWIRMAEGLPEASDYGLQGLRGTDFLMALGGSLPRAWSTAFNMLILPQAPAGAGREDAALVRAEALDRIQRQILSLHAVMAPPPATFQKRLTVADPEAYLRELEAFFRLDSSQGLGLQPRRLQVGDADALALFMTLPAAEGEAAPREQAVMVALRQGASTILIQTGPDALTPPAEDPRPPVLDSAVLRPAAALLPDRAHFYAFLDGRRMSLQQEGVLQMQEAQLTEPERLQLPALPETPSFPALGFALAFTPGAWDLHLALPWETQVGLGLQLPARAKAVAARTAAVQKVLAERPRPEGAEGPEAGEEPEED